MFKSLFEDDNVTALLFLFLFDIIGIGAVVVIWRSELLILFDTITEFEAEDTLVVVVVVDVLLVVVVVVVVVVEVAGAVGDVTAVSFFRFFRGCS